MRKFLFMPKVILMLMTFLALTTTLWAQNRVNGTVTNAADKLPL